LDARKERHYKMFGKMRTEFARVRQLQGRMKLCAENARQRFVHPLSGTSPAQQLFQRVMVLALFIFVVNSVSLTSAYDIGGSYESSDYLAIDTSVNLVTDDEGYLAKVTPWEGEAQYLNRGNEWVTHEVQSGDTLSVIAYRYGLNANTILWANTALGNVNYLKVGQQLRIPPANGYEATVKSGENLDKLYAKYYDGTDEEKDAMKTRTIAMNNLSEDGAVEAGAKIFVVGGEKPYEPPVYTTTATVTTASTTIKGDYYTEATNMDVDVVDAGEGWVRPTAGAITQWFHWGHYAIDISDTSKPPVVAIRDGTVTRAVSDGSYSGGYGNVIVINHGDTPLGNCQSLYAHNSTVHVQVGDYVTTGQIISNQGNTGRVYGKTGIHLHIELTCDGVKINPAFLYGY